ncbi:MAG: zinc ABC transporter substrate-binding protein [Gammaproteobacteria bacterium]|nr:zinc ABC transporter substrate-binding protein [Gammaproteobacteria bacterium]
MIQGLYLPRIVLFFLLGMFFSLSSYANLANVYQTNSLNKVDNKGVNKELHIVSTIKPIHLLVKEIVGDQAKLSLLIPENVSTHDYRLRPSDLKKLTQADVIIRISENLEIFLNKLLSQKQVIILANTPQLSWLSIRHSHEKQGNSHDTHQHEEEDHNEEEKEDGDEEHQLGHDPHIWLDANNTIKMVTYIREQISAIDPSHRDEYRKNSHQLIAKIKQADQQAKQVLQKYQPIPYLVFHDGWQYWEHAYGLKKPHVISFHEDLPPGIKTILTLRQQIKAQDIHCLIASPFNNKKIIKTITEGLPIKVIWLSASGAKIPIDQHSEFMKYNISQFSDCLQGH